MHTEVKQTTTLRASAPVLRPPATAAPAKAKTTRVKLIRRSSGSAGRESGSKKRFYGLRDGRVRASCAPLFPMSGFRLFDLNPEQEHAVRTTDGPLLILAGAGTGKTRVITMRVAYLIAQGVEPGHILAVTFTNKAANEMRERLARMIEPSVAKKVTASTFHALCVRILRQDIERLGYKKNFSIYDDGDQLGMIRKDHHPHRREG